MSVFSFKSEAFGLDISDFSVRFANLRKEKDKIKIVSFGEEKIPQGVVCSGEIKDKNQLRDIVKKAIENPKGEKLKTKCLVSSLPEEKSYLDIIQLPFLPREETENAVAHEIENHIPLPINEVYFGWEKVNSSLEEKKIQEILIVASPKKIVDDYVFVLKSAGLEVVGLEIECLAIVRALVRQAEARGPFLIVDFGGSRTTFIFYSDKTVRFTSTIPFSSVGLSRAIAEKLNVSVKDGEKLKIKHGIKGDKKIKDILLPNLEKFSEEIKNGIEYYQTHEHGSQILRNGKNLEKIMLCGAAANLKGLVDFLEKRLKIEIGLANPFLNISAEPSGAAQKLGFGKSLAYATTLGLALRGANL